MFDITVDFPKMRVAVATRAVGQACGDNLEAKRWLLAHEIRPEEFALLP